MVHTEANYTFAFYAVQHNMETDKKNKCRGRQEAAKSLPDVLPPPPPPASARQLRGILKRTTTTSISWQKSSSRVKKANKKVTDPPICSTHDELDNDALLFVVLIAVTSKRLPEASSRVRRTW
ncbi:hypothetical protein DPMN_068306 [Dreissena polymorpha]|uniref:Uncharacterized protein n=1 Tax=Dreissena polymorpha TaxID=45954 RepID=A0A9D3YYZ4_DREPO|nr:hypothetical protein DPMN_068306 [Dreissena polymorpha]